MEGDSPDDALGKAFRIFILLLIALNVLAVILETTEPFSSYGGRFFSGFEVFSVAVFTVEYLLRLWSCTADERYRAPVLGRLRFAAAPMALVDLLAILPFYLQRVIVLDLRFIRAVRLFRLFRLLKLGRYARSLNVLRNVLGERKEALLIALFLMVMLLVLGGSLLFYVEGGKGSETFSSIPSAILWVIAKTAGVGAGAPDPASPSGRLFGAAVVLLSRILVIALPAAILASGFISEFQRRKGD